MKLACFALGLLLCFPVHDAKAATLPDWADVAVGGAPATPAGAHVHVLFEEYVHRVPARGRVTSRERGVWRVVDGHGVKAAFVRVPFSRTSARVTNLRAWLQSPDGRVREFKRSDAADVSLVAATELENERRALVIVPEGVELGSVFAWEWEVEEDALLSDLRLVFASEWPCAKRRYVLTLPPGCEPRVVHSQGQVPAPVRVGDSWQWEKREIPALPDEALSAAWPLWLDHAVVVPEPRGAAPGRSFTDWREVGAWLQGVSEPSVSATPEVARKAQELVAGLTDPIERASALARYVQGVNYLAISLGLAHGDGYRPRPAATVLASGYGDCKDKAALFCALSRSVGLQAWLATASLEGRDHVREGWSSPGQFNHCIAAVALPPGNGLAAAVAETPLGPLVFFDGTDSSAPFGSLSSSLAGSSVLLVDAERSGLVRLPPRPATAERCSSLLTGVLDERGTLRAEWRYVARGPEAWRARAQRAASEHEWRRSLESDLGAWLGPCKVTRLEAADRPEAGTFTVSAAVEVARYAKSLGASLVGFPTRARHGPLRWDADDTTRVTPIALRGAVLHDSVSIRLPEGWRVDALPRPAQQETDFGALSANWQESDGAVHAGLRTSITPATLPAGRFREWRSLLGVWAYVNRTQVVAKRP